MVLHNLGGHRATIEVPMLIFLNENWSYPIQSLLDDIPRISYRTNSKGSINQTIFPKYFLEPSAYQTNLYQCMKIIWLDDCRGHAIDP